MNLISKLPYEILIQIYQYNPEHREKMKWVLDSIRNIQYCDVCRKVCTKYIYSRRRSDMICCSIECVDNY
jgi:hypothetical protein